MLILSTKHLAAANRELRYQDEGGQIIHVHKSKVSHFVSASGVYFMKMPVAREHTTHVQEIQLSLPSKDKGMADEDFGRQGAICCAHCVL